MNMAMCSIAMRWPACANRMWRRDLVQETFLAAMRAHEKFAGQSTMRSWLCGILKHKLSNYYRTLGRATSYTDLEFLDDE